MNQAIATGKLVSFALISFFSIFREGAETIIFYSGMAPYMSIKQMMIGIVIATAILLVVVSSLFVTALNCRLRLSLK